MHLHSFWWRIFKKAFKRALEPFESFGKICALITGMLAVGCITHSVTREWGDYMIYWTGAVPVVIWSIYFLWNLIKIPHRMYEEGLEARSGNEKNGDQSFARTIFIVFLISAFLGFWAFKNYQITQLKDLLAPPTAPKEKITEITLPIKIIPRPELPPSSAQITSNPLPSTVVTTQPLETFNANTDESEDFVLSIAKIKAGQVAQAEEQHRQNNLEAQKVWVVYLPYYKRSLIVLHDTLLRQATKESDGIEQSEGYFQCLPASIDVTNGEIKLAEIKFQKNTNMDFLIKLSGLATGSHRSLKISSGGCEIDMEAEWGDYYHRILRIGSDFNDMKRVPIAEADDFIPSAINDLIDARKYSLVITNK
jgi:hypothetical protein